MRFKLQTKITFINKKSNETQTEIFYSGIYDLDPITASKLNDLIKHEQAYWTFNIEKLGGHKIIDMITYMMTEFASPMISDVKQFIKAIGDKIQEYYDHQFEVESQQYRTQKFKNILEKEYKEDLDCIYSSLSSIQTLMEDRQ